jgi:predicted transcriptional regulator of viral defense system
MNQGLDLIKRVVVELGPIFSVDGAKPAAEDLGLSETQLRWTLSRLARDGWLVRLKRGLYAAQPPLSGSDLHPFAVAAALVQTSAISHWSALAYHGLTTQIPPMVQASTTRRVVTPEMRQGQAYRPRGHAVWSVLDWQFEFITVRAKSWFGFQQEWVSQWHRVSITDPERTMLDMFAHPSVFGSIRTGMETLERSIDSLDLDRLIGYALRYKVGALIKRLGWTLEILGAPDSLVGPLREFPVSNVPPLDPTGPAAGSIVPDWQVRNNLLPVETNR